MNLFVQNTIRYSKSTQLVSLAACTLL